MNNWQTFTGKERLTYQYEVKTFDNKVVSIGRAMTSAIFDKSDNEIDFSSILSFRAKKDWNRYNRLQKHYNELEKYDFDTLDNFEFAIYDTYKDQEDKKKVEKLFKKLKKHIETAQQQILTESKAFL
jgi:hypothetical protein